MAVDAGLIDAFLTNWSSRMLSACWLGGLVLLSIWCICHLWKTCTPHVRCWLWRIGYLKFILLLLFAGVFPVPVLPEKSTDRLAPVAALLPESAALETGAELYPAMQPVTQVTPISDHSPQDVSSESMVSPWLAIIFLTWVIGVLWNLYSMARQRFQLRKVLSASIRVDHARIDALVGGLCQQFNLRQVPDTRTTSRCQSPMLIGTFRPAILIPRQLISEASVDQLRMVLAHELVHIKRRDLMWNWLPALVRTCFFFHPLVWLAEPRWILAQELACDDAVLRETGAPAFRYGALLVRVSQLPNMNARANLATLGVASSFTTLKTRINAMNQANNRSILATTCAAVGVLMLGTVVLLPLKLVAKQQESSTDSGTASSQQTAETRASQSRQDNAGDAVTSDQWTKTGSTMVSISNDDGQQSIKVEWKDKGMTVTYKEKQGDTSRSHTYTLDNIEQLRDKNQNAYDFYKKHVVSSFDETTGGVVSGFAVGGRSGGSRASASSGGGRRVLGIADATEGDEAVSDSFSDRRRRRVISGSRATGSTGGGRAGSGADVSDGTGSPRADAASEASGIGGSSSRRSRAGSRTVSGTGGIADSFESGGGVAGGTARSSTSRRALGTGSRSSRASSVENLINQIQRTMDATDNQQIKDALQRAVDELKKANR